MPQFSSEHAEMQPGELKNIENTLKNTHVFSKQTGRVNSTQLKQKSCLRDVVLVLKMLC